MPSADVKKNIMIYGSDYVDREAKNTKVHSQKVDILAENLEAKNMLTEEDPNHRKQEFLKSNIFSQAETRTQTKEKYETGKNKVQEDKVFDVFNEKTMQNKRKELDTHFTIGDNVDFVNYQTNKP